MYKYHSNLTQDQIWAEFDRMQQWAMTPDSIVTRKQFFAESEKRQRDYYDWMCQQVPDHLIGRFWSRI